MRIEVDARNKACPKPVIMTKKALDDIVEGVITTIVDNEVAKENVSKLAKSMNLKFGIEKKDNYYYINITKGSFEDLENQVCTPNSFKDMTIVFGKDTFGDGSEELGKILIKGFIYTLTESAPFPSTLVFLNSGVKLTTEGSEVIDDLKKLEEEGVEIISCGTCLDYYNLGDKLLVGEISNMYTILEKIKNANNTFSI